MDNLTHTLSGLVLAEAGLSRMTRGATLALVLASNLPDVDLVSAFGGSVTYLQHHRDLTHSVVGGPVLALALAGVLRMFVRSSRFGPLALCSLIGVAGHVFMDYWTSYGTRVLAPFDRGWYTVDLVFIVDPAILLLLLSALWIGRRFPEAGTRAASVALGLVLTYVGARAALHARALDVARALVPVAGSVRMAALPDPIDPWRWTILADAGDAYFTGTVQLDGRSTALTKRIKRPEDALVARVRRTSAVAAIFLDFSRFPWLEESETPEGTTVVWSDLRFQARGRDSFLVRVVVDRDGRIRSESFRF